MAKLSKKQRIRRERSMQYGASKRNGSSWSEDLLNLHMNNDLPLTNYVIRNRRRLLKMKKGDKIRALKSNGFYIKGDAKNIKNKYVRRNYLDQCIRDVPPHNR